MSNKQKQTAIIGAGITGLVTAFYLHKNKIPFHIYEKSDHIGGVIQTTKEGDFIYESGPNSGTISTPETAELFEDLNLKPEVANSASAKRLIWKNGRWHALPSGLAGGVTTPLFTFGDKLRILGEPFRKKGNNPDETLADLVRRRMGKSFLNYAVDPFILGIYAGDPEYIVPKYALPKLYNLEQEYGSFVGGTIKKRKEPKDPRDDKATREIFSAEGGLEELVHALVAVLGKDNITTQCGTLTIEQKDHAYTVNGKEYTHVVSTVNAPQLPVLFPFIKQQQFAAITNLKYARVTEVALGFKKWDGMSLDAFGGLIPFRENRDILGVLFMSTLFKNRAPKGGALITTFVGGMRKPEHADLKGKDLEDLIAKEMKITMGLKSFRPDLFRPRSYTEAIAQYGADSGPRLEAISEIEEKHPGLFLAGSIRNGIGMADRIKQGRQLAEQIAGLKGSAK
ncbi:MAG: protoporphyrinogen oxidase [Bacteroidales bacterium]|nr:protoporphyrinogen oxidase [Bacteroidales bacterium]